MRNFRRAALALLMSLLLTAHAGVPAYAAQMADAEAWAAAEAAAEQEILAIEAAVAAAAAQAEAAAAEPAPVSAEEIAAQAPAAPAPGAAAETPAAPPVPAAAQIPSAAEVLQAAQAAVSAATPQIQAVAVAAGTLAESAAQAVTGTAWTGTKLTKRRGVNMGPSGKETYYNLDMTKVIEKMRGLGYTGEYWVREDGCKMFGSYIMCAANYAVYPLGTLVESSLGTCIICDTGGFAASNPNMLDIAVTW